MVRCVDVDLAEPVREACSVGWLTTSGPAKRGRS
jgi:hypothetical protein